MNVLLVRLGSLGDIVHALPVAAALKDHCPDARLDWLVDGRHVALLELVPLVDRRIVVSPSGRLRIDRPGHPGDRHFAGRAGVLAALRFLRRQQYNVAIDLQGLIKSAVFARASGARRVIGFDRAHLREPQARAFYTESVVPPSGVHVVVKNLAVLQAVDAPVAPAPRFEIDIPFSPGLEAVRAALGPDTLAQGYALINPGAAWPNKRWAPERFGAVAAALNRRHRLPSVVAWGPGEETLARRVVAASDGAAVAAPPTGIADLLAIARGAALVVSGDTGPLHLAAAVGAPIVALFGPTDPARNGPWSPDDVSLSRFAECVCHYERRCRRTRPCIEDISVEDVLAAIERRLAIPRRAHA